MSDQVKPQGTSKPVVPGAVAALIVGINSCIWGWLYGIPGIILSIIGLIMAGNASRKLEANPTGYRMGNIVKSAKTWSIVGLIQSIIISVIMLIGFIVIAATSSSYGY